MMQLTKEKKEEVARLVAAGKYVEAAAALLATGMSIREAARVIVSGA